MKSLLTFIKVVCDDRKRSHIVRNSVTQSVSTIAHCIGIAEPSTITKMMKAVLFCPGPRSCVSDYGKIIDAKVLLVVRLVFVTLYMHTAVLCRSAFKVLITQPCCVQKQKQPAFLQDWFDLRMLV